MPLHNSNNNNDGTTQLQFVCTKVGQSSILFWILSVNVWSLLRSHCNPEGTRASFSFLKWKWHWSPHTYLSEEGTSREIYKWTYILKLAWELLYCDCGAHPLHFWILTTQHFFRDKQGLRQVWGNKNKGGFSLSTPSFRSFIGIHVLYTKSVQHEAGCTKQKNIIQKIPSVGRQKNVTRPKWRVTFNFLPVGGYYRHCKIEAAGGLFENLAHTVSNFHHFEACVLYCSIYIYFGPQETRKKPLP